MSRCSALRGLLAVAGFNAVLAFTAHAGPPSEGLIAHFPFDGDALDASGYGRNGTPESISFTPGRIGQAATFGQGSSVLAERMPLEATSFSVAAWVKLDSFGPQQAMQIVGQRDIEASGQCTNDQVSYLVSCGEWILNVYDQQFAFEIATRSDDGSPPEQTRIAAPGLPALDRYYSVVATFDDSSGRAGLWIDGTLRVQQTVGTSLGIQPNAKLSIGRNWPTGATQHWHGDIDDIRIYDRVLSEIEIGGIAAPVPEPASLATMLAGLLLVCAVRARLNTRTEGRAPAGASGS